MPRDPRVEKLQRLRTERVTRAPGGYYGTRATAYGNARSGPRQRDMGRTLLSLVLFVVLVVAVFYGASRYVLRGSTPSASQADHAVTVNIPPGATASDIATELHDKGLVFNATVFYVYMRLTGVDNVRFGPHTFRTSMGWEQLTHALTAAPPPVAVATVQIIDGWRAEQVAQALAQAHVASYNDVMNEVQKGDFHQYGFLSDRPPGATLEGYLFPDTYEFTLNEGAHKALNRMLTAFNQKVVSMTDVVTQGKKRYRLFYNAVKLASIVQREAGTNKDRGLIASVYLNRLNDRSGQFKKLNADPTVQYALGHQGDWWPNIDKMNLSTVNNPFNTYQNPGLPPLPISEPTAASIKATVNPPTTPYFYFWHQPGSHSKSIFCTAAQGPQCAGTPQ